MKEKSAGTVIYKQTKEGRKFLLLHYPSGHWDFVKGKMEKGENPTETVIRETFEETGITDLEFVDGFEENIEYNFQFEGTSIHKTVVFFLAKTNTNKIRISHEHQNYLWLDFEEALSKITFENARRVLSRANKLLSNGL